MTYAKAVAMRFVKLLAEHNMTQYRFLKISGMTPSTLISILREKTKDVKLSTIGTMADTFGISLREFFNDPLFDSPNIEL